MVNGSAPKRDSISEKLRKQIVGGGLQPGQRLPTRTELEKRFKVSSLTVQLALDQLSDDGFVRADGRRGTFVADAPPHLHRYALVFPSFPNQAGEWPRFWTALANEALEMQAKSPRRMAVFHGVNGQGTSEDYRRLLEDVRQQRLAGMIFAAPPFFVAGTPLMTGRSIPRVAIQNWSEHDTAAVGLNLEGFLIKAFDHFAAKGRRRVCMLAVPGYCEIFQKRFDELLSERGLATEPYWLQSVNQATPQTARNLTHLLMRGHERPDALLIADDNLVEHATAGLVAAGIHVPDDLEVVAHCNFPHPTPSVLPVRRLGFDARQVLRACVESIDAQRRGETELGCTTIEPVFEEETQSTALAG